MCCTCGGGCAWVTLSPCVALSGVGWSRANLLLLVLFVIDSSRCRAVIPLVMSILIAAIFDRGRAATIKEVLEKGLDWGIFNFTVTRVRAGCDLCGNDFVLVCPLSLRSYPRKSGEPLLASGARRAPSAPWTAAGAARLRCYLIAVGSRLLPPGRAQPRRLARRPSRAAPPVGVQRRDRVFGE